MTEDMSLDGQIVQIIQSETIAEQADLQAILKVRGFDVPQATLSRRLKKLNIAKVSGIYKRVSSYQAHLPSVLKMQVSDHGLIVLHTHPGQAASLAYFLDQKYLKGDHTLGILGSIAGDDTVLLITQGLSVVDAVLAVLRVDFL